MEHLSNDHEDHSNKDENSHKLCNETGHPVLSLLESQWKVRQQHVRISRWRESHCRRKLVSEEMNKSKRRSVRVTVRDPSRNVNHLSKIN